MKLGFTGTEDGMTREQEFSFRHLVLILQPVEFHHGMCVGADEEAHYIIKVLNRLGKIDCRIVGHPGVTKDGKLWKRATFLPGLDDEWPPKYFLDRNPDIVRVTDFLVATPAEPDETLRSGTWATVREAQRTRKPFDVIQPDGNIVHTRPV